MSNWKHYLTSGFAGCRLLAYARDHCRMRDVRLYLIPGQADDIGVTDGTDSWIAPATADVFSVNVRRLLDDLRSGKGIPKPVPPAGGRQRRQLIENETTPFVRMSAGEPAIQNMPRRPRPRLIEEAEPATAPQPSTAPRRRRAQVE